MKSLKQLFIVCFLLACFFSCKTEHKQDIETNRYAEFLNKLQKQGITTGNVLVYKNGKVVYKNASGLRSINPKDSLTLDSQFRLASVSKQFTGMAIMKLKEAGKLDYDQKVNSILPNFPYADISIRHLLYHTSGLTDYERLLAYNWKPADSTKKYILGNDEIIKEIYRVNPELDFKTGEKWEYSNTGYLFLASIVEKVSGQHFRTFLKEQIFEPLKMNNTVLYKYQEAEDLNMPNRVFGYETTLNQLDLKLNDYNLVNDVRGDGGIYSTLEDLYKWNMALVNSTIISKEYLDEAFKPGKLNNGEETRYGFGWFIESKNEPKVVFHSGGWVGFGTYLYNELDDQSGMILLTNNSNNNLRDIVFGLTNISKNKPYEMPKLKAERVLAKKILNEDIDKGIAYYHEIKTDTTTYEVTENNINQLGYLLLQNGNVNESIQIFKLNIDEYPESANVYDSYGDALLEKGDSINALSNFKKCYEMDNTLEYALDKATKLEAMINKNI
ncbi:beta-lactamase family protein [uncultured Lacinutrix sp.]|uniref:beta-lactamase family protein n=1 Tax=uncultured Lacinutrix sp. TaxID=574032 RepID=UPI002623433C|nr:beta-lactamase family protein [uncultured Lacinutrix sp.]